MAGFFIAHNINTITVWISPIKGARGRGQRYYFITNEGLKIFPVFCEIGRNTANNKGKQHYSFKNDISLCAYKAAKYRRSNAPALSGPFQLFYLPTVSEKNHNKKLPSTWRVVVIFWQVVVKVFLILVSMCQSRSFKMSKPQFLATDRSVKG